MNRYENKNVTTATLKRQYETITGRETVWVVFRHGKYDEREIFMFRHAALSYGEWLKEECPDESVSIETVQKQWITLI